MLALILALSLAPQDAAKQRLDKSPRHAEWTETKNGDRVVHSFVVFPEVKEKAPVVVVIHENRGLNDWARAVADRLAENGFIAIAPDLLSGMGPKGGRTSGFATSDDAREAISKLPADQVTKDLDAVCDAALKIEAASGKISVAGFCWGGTQAFRFATHRAKLSASFVFYGSGPDDKEAIGRITCPVYGFYGGDDLHARRRGGRREGSQQEGARAGLEAVAGAAEEVVATSFHLQAWPIRSTRLLVAA